MMQGKALSLRKPEPSLFPTSPIVPPSRGLGALLSQDVELTSYRARESDTYDSEGNQSYTIEMALNSKWFYSIIVFLVFVAIFLGHIRLLFFPKSWDLAVDLILISIIVIFIVESLLYCRINPEYRRGFYIWMDTLIALSLLTDVALFWEVVWGTDTTSRLPEDRASAFHNSFSTVHILQFVRITHWTFFVNFIRKCVSTEDASKGVIQSLRSTRNSQSLALSRRSSGGKSEEFEEPNDKFKQGLNEKIIRVVYLVILISFVVQFVLRSVPKIYTLGGGLAYLGTLTNNPNITAAQFQSEVEHFYNVFDSKFPILFVNVTGLYHSHTWQNPDMYSEYRLIEKAGMVVQGQAGSPDYVGIYSIRYTTKLDSLYHMILQVIIMSLVILSVWLMQKDLQTLVIGPVQKLVDLVTRDSFDSMEMRQVIEEQGRKVKGMNEESVVSPLARVHHSPSSTTVVTHLGHVTDRLEENLNEEDRSEYTKSLSKRGPMHRGATEMLHIEGDNCEAENTGYNDEEKTWISEFDLLELTLAKLTRLLYIGFGQAGHNIIRNNLKTKGELRPIVQGHKVMAIYTFMDIRQFTDMTECLQEDVMLFVNKVAEIAYRVTVNCDGMPNKNVGDAFLCVWKLPEAFTEKHLAMLQGGLVHSKYLTAEDTQIFREVCLTADKSLTSVMRIMREVDESKTLRLLGFHPNIRKRFQQDPCDFRVRLGCGIHVGWAIEGAIGSQYKIDASYLSPHVDMTMNLEEMTKRFKMDVVASESFVSLLSKKMFDILQMVGDTDCPVSTVQDALNRSRKGLGADDVTEILEMLQSSDTLSRQSFDRDSSLNFTPSKVYIPQASAVGRIPEEEGEEVIEHEEEEEQEALARPSADMAVEEDNMSSGSSSDGMELNPRVSPFAEFQPSPTTKVHPKMNSQYMERLTLFGANLADLGDHPFIIPWGSRYMHTVIEESEL